jgi:prepilin-type N-terminal cleavage/methylation domain-containing protein
VTRRARRQAGFTLIELTVALVAGLIVALGIMGLSRDATHTFHEEMRSSAAEANLRTGIDRLRADLGRAGYMSTGNILTDPMIARAPGQPAVSPGFAGLARLASITLNQGGSAGNTPLSAQQLVHVNPDSLDIAGNMTSTDQYEVSVIQPTGSSMCGGQRVSLDANSPSMFRVLGLGDAGGAELYDIFQPSPDGTGRFIVRIADKTGFSQYVVTCSTTPAGIGGGTPYIDIDPATPILMAKQTGTVGGLNGYGSGALVNPVQIVHWELVAATAEPAQYGGTSPLAGQPLAPTTPDPTKYDLVRWFVDAASGQPIASTIEVVAEYVVDFEVSFSVDTGVNGLQPNIVTFAFDDTVNPPKWAPNLVAAPPPFGVGPERIRSVRVRLATRTSEADRTLDVTVPNQANEPFMYRYCILPGGCAAGNNTLQYARVRTVTADVALINQARRY